jgi:hypothetical protein
MRNLLLQLGEGLSAALGVLIEAFPNKVCTMGMWCVAAVVCGGWWHLPEVPAQRACLLYCLPVLPAVLPLSCCRTLCWLMS